MVLFRVLANLLVLHLSYGSLSGKYYTSVSSFACSSFQIMAFLLQLEAQKSSELVIGGDECNINEHRSLVLLYNASGFRCGGTLINQQWVLSAAHCNMENMQIHLGLHNFRLPNEDQKIRVPKEKFFCLNSTSNTRKDNDIMLIKLKKPVNNSIHIAPLSLPSSPPSEGSVCRIMGWGTITSPNVTMPYVPHCANIQILPYWMCRASYALPPRSRKLCAGIPRRRIVSCKGDSGGPLICNGEIQGIVSYGKRTCGKNGAPSIYTKVYDYTDWIQSIIAGNTAATCPPLLYP